MMYRCTMKRISGLAQLLALVAITISVGCVPNGNCANILVLDSVPSPSHQIWMRALIKGISTQHNVTHVSVGEPRDLGPNVTTIHMEEVFNEMARTLPAGELVEMSSKSAFSELPDYKLFCEASWLGSVKSKGMQTLLNYPDDFKFDLVIHDFGCGSFFLHFAVKFNSPPIVGATAFGLPPYSVELLGGHSAYAYIPYYASYFTTEMNFWQRAYNKFLYLAHIWYMGNVMGPSIDEIARQYINKNLPSLRDLERTMILGLSNINQAVDLPIPLPPTVIPVGGLHIETPKPLPKDLEDFLQSSVKGAILFALGTNIRSDLLGAEKQTKLIQAIAEMPEYNFLWKFESDNLPMELPKNLIVRKFLPQNDILAHPKTKGFISHGGQLSSQESTWYGVPMIIIPFFSDQHRNAQTLKKDGVCETIQFNALNKDDVKRKVLQVMDNPKYRQNMMLRSKHFRDQPELPIERAVWWINYALRNPNPEHLQSPVKRLGYWRANCYDIQLTLIGFVLGIAYGVWKIIGLCFGKKSQKKKLKRN